MSGHWICEACGYDGEHAEYCRCLRPPEEQWRGHRTPKEMEELRNLTAPLSSSPQDTITPERDNG